MELESQKSTSSSTPQPLSYWADPKRKRLWQAAHAKMVAGEPLAPQRRIPVVLNQPYDSILLKDISGLTNLPRFEEVERLSLDRKGTGEYVYICRLSEEVIFRLDGYIDKSEECLVRIDQQSRFADIFKGNGRISIESEQITKTTPPVRVLSLDGSNLHAQGRQQLLILKTLLTTENRSLEPGNVFDLIGGVGISGLISIWLGRLNCTIDKCLSLLDALSSDGYDRFKDVCRKSAGEEYDLNEPLMNDSKHQNSFVIANVEDAQEEVLLRTYYGSDPQMLSEKTSILDAVQSSVDVMRHPICSSNFPNYTITINNWLEDMLRLYLFPDGRLDEDRFREAQPRKNRLRVLDQQNLREYPFNKPGYDPIAEEPSLRRPLLSRPPFRSGGYEWHNPVYHAYREARSIWPDRDIVIVSIGSSPMPLSNITRSEDVMNRFKIVHPGMAKDSIFRFQADGNFMPPDSLFTECAKRLAI